MSNDLSYLKNNISKIIIPDYVTLIAVSKRKTIEEISYLNSLGIENFGESYLSEAIDKIISLSDKNINWHFIGPIQSNKIKLIAKHFDFVQSVSSEKIIRKLNSACEELDKVMPVLIQINIGEEKQKSGVIISDTQYVVDLVNNSSNLDFKGFMCIPPFGVDPKPYFDKMKKLLDTYNSSYNISILSMGMSLDYTLAIECGSNMVRIGSNLFGSR